MTSNPPPGALDKQPALNDQGSSDPDATTSNNGNSVNATNTQAHNDSEQITQDPLLQTDNTTPLLETLTDTVP
jgi:hypothetical protein